MPRTPFVQTRPGAKVLLLLGALAIAVVVVLGARRHNNPHRCASDWVSLGPRCCAKGQSLQTGHCRGIAQQCPAGFHAPLVGHEGCVVDARRVRIPATKLSIGPNDWQSEQVKPIDASVFAFDVDATEVTYEQWRACESARHCPHVAVGEWGQPVTRVTPEHTQAYCADEGGRLPRLDERMAMAAGAASRRYPWGQTGLVCRRAVFGVAEGPCAEHGAEPDIAGSHPDGQSPDGVQDLSGNVAELTLDANGKAWVCGGSFRSQTALELKSWACVLWTKPADDVGFRCVYDVNE